MLFQNSFTTVIVHVSSGEANYENMCLSSQNRKYVISTLVTNNIYFHRTANIDAYRGVDKKEWTSPKKQRSRQESLLTPRKVQNK